MVNPCFETLKAVLARLPGFSLRRRKPSSMRIRSSLILLVIAALLPVVLSTAVALVYVYDEQQGDYRQSIQDTSRAMSLALDRELARSEAILAALAASPALERGDLQSFYVHAKKVVDHRAQAVLLQDASANVILDTRTPYGTAAMSQDAPVGARGDAARPEGAVISDLIVATPGQPGSRAFFHVRLPVNVDGQLKYYVTLASLASTLQPLLEEHQLPVGWFGTVLDRNGVIVARTHESERFVGRTAPAETRTFMRANREGFFDVTTLHGIRVTAFTSRAPKSGWTFIVGAPRSQLDRAAIQGAAMLTTIAVLSFALAIVIALFVGRRIARPIEHLRRAAARMKDGRAMQPQRSGMVEVDAVSAELARTSMDIHDAYAQFETRVADAVATAERTQKALLQAQKLEALGRLTGGIAHDFNNVLQTLGMGLQVAALSTDRTQIRKTLETCERAVKRAAELVRQLMAFGRVQEAHIATVALPATIAALTPMLKGALRDDIELEMHMDEAAWPVNIDPLQFELALLNLTINARDAMPERGTVSVFVANQTVDESCGEIPPGDYVQIAVRDTGHGMSPEVLARALEPFFTTKSVGKGSGLGLAQVYGFTRQAGGHLRMESGEGAGTSVLIYLPRAECAPAATVEPKDTDAYATLEGSVLLVDDDLLVLDVVKPALEAAGLKVRIAQNGADAMILLNAGEPFDIVFSDIMMPGGTNGVELARMVGERFPHTAVILATGYSAQRVNLPGVRVLGKPYAIRDVVDTFRKALDEAGCHAAPHEEDREGRRAVC